MTEMPTQTMVPDNAALSQPTAKPRHPEQDTIDPLIAAGVVTHLVTVNESLEPLFATAQIKALPEVKFVAAFEGGLIALGCPSGLPAALSDLACPAPSPRAKPCETATNDGRIGTLLDRMTALETAIQSPDIGKDVIDVVETRLADLTKRLDARPDPMPTLRNIATRFDTLPQPQAPDLRGLEARLEQLAQHLAEISAQTTSLSKIARNSDPSPTLTDALNRIDARLATLSTSEGTHAILQTIEANAPPDIADALSALHAQVKSLEDRPAPILDLSDQREGFNQFATVLGMIVKRVEKAVNDIPQTAPELVEQQRGFANFSETLTAATDRLEAVAETLTSVPQENEIKNAISQLSEMLDGIGERLGTLAAPNERIAGLEGKIDALAALRDLAFETLSGLGAKIDAVAERPDPVIDLTEQRAEFGRFTSAMARATARLDSTIAPLCDLPSADTLDAKLTEVTAQINALPDHLRSELSTVVEQAQPTVIRLSEMQDDIAQLLERADPVPLIEMQGEALSATAKKMTAVQENIDTHHQQGEVRAQEIVAVVQSLPYVLDSTIKKACNLGPLQSDIVQLQDNLDALPERIGLPDLSAAVQGMIDRPDPVIDLTAQREGFARFGAAAGAVIKRLDGVVQELKNSAEQPPLALITDAVSRVEDVLGTLSKAHSSESATIAKKVERLTKEIDLMRKGSEQDVGTLLGRADTASALDTLRMEFAELIALQIKENSASFEPLPH